MPVFQCTSCSGQLQAADDFLGQTVHCPHCQQPTKLELLPPNAHAAATVNHPTAASAPMAVPVAAAANAVASNEDATASFGGINVEQDGSSVSHASSRREKSKLVPTLVIAGSVVIVVAIVAVVIIALGSSRELALDPIADQTVNELESVTFTVAVTDADTLDDTVEFELVEGPAGAVLDSKSGVFEWTPNESQGPGNYSVVIRAKAGNTETVGKPRNFSIVVAEQNQPPVVDPVAAQMARPGEVLLVQLKATDPDFPSRKLQYRLGPEAPAGASVHPQTGIFSWQPASGDSGRTHTVAIVVAEARSDGASTTCEFQVQVQPAETALERMVAKLKSQNAATEIKGTRTDALFPEKPCQVLMIDGEEILVAEYASFQEANEQARVLQDDSDELFGPTGKHGRLFQSSNFIALYPGDDATVLNHLDMALGRPFLTVRDPSSAVVSNLPTNNPPVKPLNTEETGPFTKSETDVLVTLHTEKQLFALKHYKDLRTVFAQRFVRLHGDDIKTAFGEQYEEMSTWLAENEDLRDELYMAIDPDSDNVQEALRLFKQLKDEFPQEIVAYGNLAIAIAVTWDDPQAIYDYGNHQRRAKTTMPDDLAGPTENFTYFVEAERLMHGRAQWLPWEFLVLVVNNKTPLKEREWALRNYVRKRVMFGKCYSEVPYDTLMLDSKSAQAKLNGQVYNLPNILAFGGVCAHQADYASRVGQSLGVPAAYVGGENTYGGNHAWVMWVEIKAVSATSIAFTLESHGRYRGDKYYVGTLKDPQTGKRITDRQLELRLHTVGLNAAAKRQAEMAMTAYPQLVEKESMDVAAQFAFLSDVVKLCPGNEEAWRAIAKMASNETVRKDHKKKMTAIINQLFTNFSNFPDFTWEVFDDLTQIEEEPKRRIAMFNRLALMYIAAQRPDLACEARLKLTDLFVEDEQQKAAIDGLVSTIYAFVDEGRYVPRMLDRLEQICQNVEGSTPALLGFYNTFLPKIPQMRGSRPSDYCIKMFERGIAKFKQHGQPQVALAYEAQLAKIKAGQVQKN